MQSVPENIYPKTCPTFPWSTECLTLHPTFPSGSVDGQQLQQHRQMANVLLLLVRVCVLNDFSHVRLFVAHQAPLFMGFSRQEYWSGLPFPPPRDLPDPGIKPRFPALQADALPSEPLEALSGLLVTLYVRVLVALNLS